MNMCKCEMNMCKRVNVKWIRNVFLPPGRLNDFEIVSILVVRTGLSGFSMFSNGLNSFYKVRIHF